MRHSLESYPERMATDCNCRSKAATTMCSVKQVWDGSLTLGNDGNNLQKRWPLYETEETANTDMPESKHVV